MRSDLAVASTYFDRVQTETGQGVKALADSEVLASIHNKDAAIQLLQQRARLLGLDYMMLVDKQHHVVASSLPENATARYPVDPGWLSGQQGKAVLEVMSPAQLAMLSPTLALRAQVPYRSARYGEKLTGHVGEGLLLHTAAIVSGRPYWLVGGVLLNHNVLFVDRLYQLVYPTGSLPARSHGATTLFLGDVRIATTVMLADGLRAEGTKVSDEVARHVLRDGHNWLERAFVVADWYVSGYQPLQDSHGKPIGMLYVGFLEQPFVLIKWMAMTGLFVLFALAMAAAAWVSWRFTQTVITPLAKLEETVSQVSAGNLEARVGQLPQQDELALLARHFDELLNRIQTQNQALTQWAGELDDKVAERTRELAVANHTLLTAQQQLFKSEKLAAVGHLAAGIAHEVNNPIAVIQGNLDLMEEVLGKSARPVQEEMRLIREQVHRVRLIVAKLLQYSRHQEYESSLQQVDPAEVAQDSLLLVRHQINRGNVVVKSDWAATRRVLVNRYELQQVLINLIVNAMQAMPDGGVLSLSSRDESKGQGVPGVLLSVADSGPGVDDYDLQRLFDPFFTRKKDGTGLGLWVCHGLIERYGGDIAVDNRPEGGAVFHVWLPCEPEGEMAAGDPGGYVMGL